MQRFPRLAACVKDLLPLQPFIPINQHSSGMSIVLVTMTNLEH
jgi:hypothetical protein